MMILPTPTRTIKQLQAASDGYKEEKEFYHAIDTLYKGGRYIESEKRKFLVKRLDEDQELYKLRLERFVYTNVLSEILTKILGRFSTGNVFINNITESFSESWSYFRENVDQDHQDERNFLIDLLKHLILYQSACIQVDKPAVSFEVVNRAQELELGLDRPFLVLYKPGELLSYSKGQWYKFLVLETVADPFGDSLTLATWRFIDEVNVIEYSAFVELKDGQIKYLVDPQTRDRKPILDDTEIPLTKQVPHGFSKTPVAHVKIPDDKYAAGQAYLKLLQYINVENGVTDTSLSSGYVQRVITPVQEKEDDYSVINEDELKSDNQHIIKAQAFKFEEIQGTSIEINLKLLDKIEQQIHQLVCIAPGDTTREALTRAAASKKMDVADLELCLMSYGSIITSIYQDLLQLVAEAIGDVKAADVISVTGLDSFDLDSLEDDIAIANEIASIKSNLSPTALRMFYGRISEGLNKNLSAAEKQIIRDEMESLEISTEPPADPKNLQILNQ